jgi:hypothetical protein
VRRLIFLGFALMAALLAACHNGRSATHPSQPKALAGAATSTATPAPPSTLPPDVLAVLKRYSFRQADLPEGYAAGGTLEVPNQQAVLDYGNPKAAEQEIAETGRQGGLGQQVFPPPTVTGSIGVSIEVFKDEAGARRWAADPPAMQANLNPTPVDASGPFGEASSATHWTQGAKSGYVLSFSRGRIVYGIGIEAPTGTESLTPAQELARSLDQKAQRQSN